VLGSGCPGGGLAPASLSFAADAGAFAALCGQDLSAHGRGELGTLLFQNPVLLGVAFRAALRAADHSSADPRIAATREVLAGFEADLRERRTTWTIGGGPLETLWLNTGVTID